MRIFVPWEKGRTMNFKKNIFLMKVVKNGIIDQEISHIT